MSKVLILSLAVRGGSALYAIGVINHLGIDKHVIASAQSEIGVPDGSILWRTHRNPIEFAVYSLTLLPYYLIIICFGLFRGNYSSLYLPYLHFWSLPFILLFKCFGRKVVITLHDGVFHGKHGVPFIQNLTNACVAFSDVLVFLTQFVREATVNSLRPHGKTVVIPHGLIVPTDIKSGPRSFKEKPNLLFFGRVLKSKGVEVLLEALSKLPPQSFSKLAIVGKHYYDLTIPNGFDKQKLEIIDSFVSEDEIGHYFNNADILIIPYVEASQSGVISIGISAAIPMIVSSVGGLKEQLSEDESYFVKPGDCNDLTNALFKLCTDKFLYENFVSKLVQKRGALTWESIASEIENQALR
jgi:glycosyltransferase involved in cell wall biosynthesis